MSSASTPWKFQGPGKNHVYTPWKFPWPHGKIQVTQTLLAFFFRCYGIFQGPMKKTRGSPYFTLDTGCAAAWKVHIVEYGKKNIEY